MCIRDRFSTIKGVVEDVVDIILNLKQVRLKKVNNVDESGEDTVYLTINRKDEFRACLLYTSRCV